MNSELSLSSSNPQISFFRALGSSKHNLQKLYSFCDVFIYTIVAGSLEVRELSAALGSSGTEATMCFESQPSAGTGPSLFHSVNLSGNFANSRRCGSGLGTVSQFNL
jgi:hypothetical protein